MSFCKLIISHITLKSSLKTLLAFFRQEVVDLRKWWLVNEQHQPQNMLCTEKDWGLEQNLEVVADIPHFSPSSQQRWSLLDVHLIWDTRLYRPSNHCVCSVSLIRIGCL